MQFLLKTGKQQGVPEERNEHCSQNLPLDLGGCNVIHYMCASIFKITWAT